MKDALKYLTVAHEHDPVDFGVMLKLGWLYNILHDDREAINWFDLASKSPDASVSAEAGASLSQPRAGVRAFRTTAWLFPFFSTRWHDAFGYGQVKTEIKLGSLPIRPYLSMRFVGDARGTTGVDLEQPHAAISLRKLFHLWRSASPQLPSTALPDGSKPAKPSSI